jgi:hypothetical protein
MCAVVDSNVLYTGKQERGALGAAAPATASPDNATAVASQNPTPPSPPTPPISKTEVQRDKGLIYYVKGGDVSATPSPPPPPKSPA